MCVRCARARRPSGRDPASQAVSSKIEGLTSRTFKSAGENYKPDIYLCHHQEMGEILRERGRLLLVAILALALSIGAVVGWTLASFSSTTSTSGSFEASASFGIQMETGTYSGNGVDDRAITVGFQPDIVIVKSNSNSEAHIRTSTMPANQDKAMVGAVSLASQTNRIQSFDSNGFIVGNNSDVNSTGRNYYWVAWKASSGNVAVGSYTGDGTSGRDITVGFNPLIGFLMSASNYRAVFRTDAFANSYRFDTNAVSNALTGDTPTAFTVGNSNESNRSGTTYYYAMFASVSGQSDTGSYTGDGVSGRVINVGFQPDFAVTKREGNNNPAWRTDDLTGSNSLRFSASAPQPNRMTALGVSGFTLGTNGDANSSGLTYSWFAFKK